MPESGEAVLPNLLVVPLVGFDAQGYRLGYGGGFYDRTIAAMTAKPRTIGVGFGLGVLRPSTRSRTTSRWTRSSRSGEPRLLSAETFGIDPGVGWIASFQDALV